MDVFLILGLLAIFLVIARQFVTLRENDRLNKALRSFSQQLEAMVDERTAKLTTLQEITSALSGATTTKQVCEIGLQAVLKVLRGDLAIFYARNSGSKEFAVIATEPAMADAKPCAATYQIARMVRQGAIEVIPAAEGQVSCVYVPVSERGQTYGLIEVEVPNLLEPLDQQTLITIGAAFGLAFEDQRRYEEARALADRDPVTGLFNHRYFHMRLEQLLAEVQRADTSLGLVLMDIDDFKLFNDTYGHPNGDELLKLIADRLMLTDDGRAFAARFGGDEFAAVLPGADQAETIEFIRRFREWLEQQSFQGQGNNRIPIRLTYGYALFPKDGSRRYEIVAAADASLYEAKRSGIAVVGTKEEDERYKAFRRYGTFTLLDGLVQSIEKKDHYTKAHCDHVSEYAVMIAETMGLSDVVQRSLALAGALHDVGKICIPDRILRKPGSLTPEEYDIVKMHVTLAANLIQHVPRRRDVLDAVVHHHERFDGHGYAKGLKGTEIPRLGRIMAVADAFSAMTLDRVYRKALPIEQAVDELKRGAGTQFDPEMVEAFIAGLTKRMSNLSSQLADNLLTTKERAERDVLSIPAPFRVRN